ncbi:MAG: site-2 protease family protein [Pseudomonadota bacterium]
MLFLIQQGQYEVVILLIIALILSLSFHEFGHAIVAKWQGDNTAERAGRLTINPIAHVDPMGLLMVVLIGIGYAKPVPTDPRNFTSRYSDLWISAAGPFMNLLVAVVTWNVYQLLSGQGWQSPGADLFFTYLAQINLLLMIFNLIPLGPLDGHYILPYFLPRHLAQRYMVFNARYGTMVFIALIVFSFMGLPLFQWLAQLSVTMLEIITLV